MTSYLVIVNPVSGSGRARHRAELLARGLSDRCEVDVVETQGRGSAAEIAGARATTVERIIAVGGDGTLNEVLSGLMALGRSAEALPELGFLPSGTANAAVRAFGFSPHPSVAARSLPDVVACSVDVGVARYAEGTRPFLLWFGAGFDAVVIDTLNASRTGLMGIVGLVRNTPGVLGALRRYPAPDIELEVDGSAFGVASSVILPNVAEFAFGGVIAKTADPFDGQLDVVALPVQSKLSLATLGLRMFTSSLHDARGVRHTLGGQIRLRSEGEVPFQLDGEPVGRAGRNIAC